MGYGIPSEVFLALCLHFADGDVHQTIDKVLQHVDQYEHDQGSYYGVAKGDFQEAIIELLKKQNTSKQASSKNIMNSFKTIIVKDLIWPILGYYDVWFNDSDVYWSTNEQINQGMPTLRNVKMKVFFQKSYHLDPERILHFLDQSGWKNIILQQYLYNGER